VFVETGLFFGAIQTLGTQGQREEVGNCVTVKRELSLRDPFSRIEVESKRRSILFFVRKLGKDARQTSATNPANILLIR